MSSVLPLAFVKVPMVVPARFMLWRKLICSWLRLLGESFAVRKPDGSTVFLPGEHMTPAVLPGEFALVLLRMILFGNFVIA